MAQSCPKEMLSKSNRFGKPIRVILGLFGALLNSFPIELAFNISLIIGNLTFIIAASYLRPALTLLCAVLCLAPLLVSLGHPYGFITFGLEAFFVSFMRSRGWYLPTADFLYWLIIGMPLTALIIWLTSSDTQGYLLFSLFKQTQIILLWFVRVIAYLAMYGILYGLEWGLLRV